MPGQLCNIFMSSSGLRLRRFPNTLSQTSIDFREHLCTGTLPSLGRIPFVFSLGRNPFESYT